MKVLAATDGSDYAQEALRQMGRLVPRDSEIVLLAVYPNPYVAALPAAGLAPVNLRPLEEQFRCEAEAFAADGAAILTREGFTRVRSMAREGDPAAIILDMAALEDVDLIVVGSHGRSGLLRVLLGSVATRVVQHATCSVLVIKHRQERVAPA
ncbi:MAG TPA: universal stress protein [Stenomitos sp.]